MYNRVAARENVEISTQTEKNENFGIFEQLINIVKDENKLQNIKISENT